MPVRFQPANVLLDAGVTLLIHATCHMPNVSRDSKGCVRPRTCCGCCCLGGGSTRSTCCDLCCCNVILVEHSRCAGRYNMVSKSRCPPAASRLRRFLPCQADGRRSNSQSHFPTPLSHTHESPCSAGSEEGGRPRGGAAGADRQEAGVCHQGRAEADCRRHHPQYDQGDSGVPRAPPCSEWATVLR